jgi:hypothetical protein
MEPQAPLALQGRPEQLVRLVLMVPAALLGRQAQAQLVQLGPSVFQGLPALTVLAAQRVPLELALPALQARQEPQA